MLAGSCSGGPEKSGATENPTVADARSFEDSLAIVEGNRLGLVAAYDLKNNVPEAVDKEEMMRGALTVLDVDTANLSYIYGLSMGQMLFLHYRELAGMDPIDKELFINAVKTTFLADTLPAEQELQGLLALSDTVVDKAQAHQQARREAVVLETREAKENRMLGEAVAAKLMSNPEYAPAGESGLLKRVDAAGSGDVLPPTGYVRLDLTLNRIDSGEEIVKRRNFVVPVADARDVLVMSLLPYMSVGETATFFMPYGDAYGVLGNPGCGKGVGPCESVMATITVIEKL